MGLFNRNKKTKWFVNKKPGNVELENNYIKLTIKHPRTESILFYKDIVDIKKGKKFVKVSSRTDEYTMSIVSDGETIIDETYAQILEKVSEYK